MENLMSITAFEDFSNDILLEIFDELNAFHLYRAFVHLNHRFDQLLLSPSLRLNAGLGEYTANEFKNSTYKQFLLYHRQRIESLSLKRQEAFSLFSIDSSFIHLQCLTLCYMDVLSLCANLTACISLPQLVSLNIELKFGSHDLSDVYQAILRLPKLQYLACSTNDRDTPILFTFPSNQRPSPIKQLIINHNCNSEQLAALLSHLPALRYLSVSQLHSSMETMRQIVMPNLRSISMSSCWIRFDQLQLFLSIIDAPLETFSFKNGPDDEPCLDGTQWEMLISESFPHLKVFDLEFFQDIELDDGSLYLCDLNGFTSPFWTERNWMCEVEADNRNAIYRIRPYKKQWYNLESSCQSDKYPRLSLRCRSVDNYPEWFTEAIHEVFTETHFRHLELRTTPVDSVTLLNLVVQFDKLDSLMIHSLSFTSNDVDSGDKACRRFLNKDSQITKVFLETITETDVLDFLSKLCPRLHYLHIDCINTGDFKCFIRSVRSKLDHSGSVKCRFLSMRLPTISDQILQQLNDVFHADQPIRHYTIQRQFDRICFERRQ